MSAAGGADDSDDFESLIRRFWGERDQVPHVSPSNERFGRYRTLRLLGRGGQGAVWLAEDETLHRPVAIKVLTALGAITQDLVRRFRREAELASRLDHPQLCAVYDSGLVDGVPYLVMRFIEGRTLAAQLDEARRRDAAPSAPTSTSTTRDAITRTLVLVEKVARGLHVAHEAGIVHRDLKPQNIMVAPSGEPVVLDFGVAADLLGDQVTLTKSGDLCGTPAYMSPEQLALGPHAVDRRTDVFALGVCLYEALTLRRPFEAPTREALFRAIQSTEATDPRRLAPAIPRDLAVVVATALQKERERRYATMADFADDLRRVRQFEPIRARKASAWLRTRRWAQRNPSIAASLSALFLVLSVALVWTNALRARNAQSLREIAQLADLKRYRDLTAWSEELFPPKPELVAGPRGIDAWLAAAQGLHDRAPALREALGSLAGSSPPAIGDLQGELDAVRRAALDELLTGLDGVAARIDAMRERRAFALQVDDRTLLDAAPLWRRAAGELAADARFSGVTLAPVRGLVPLGKDPRSGLLEFAVLQTGTPPARDPSSGELVLAEGFALVLVLLPGGTFLMGSSAQPGHLQYDRDAKAAESPSHEVTLAPFFLAKFEMTQAQWLRLAGVNPSALHAGYRAPSGYEYTSRHPVEQVSWEDAHTILSRAALHLPTEAQWEYACRAGSSSRWCFGDSPEHIGEHAWYGLNSGERTHPVGEKQPNVWGLFDV
ncbi:MAG: SUMF1/EgtB/PvdO family nonheme iron enzyme, partial [Planctomycetes bacterium]|nr:SUMF1/EgtB/PvdO family nonheme iron enzyme [Planctomycetota bacterium]